MYTIENEFLKITLNEAGASLTSVFEKRLNEELLYQPVEGSWSSQDIVIFPFVARLKNKTYTYEGKSYEFENHGLIRYMTLDAKNISSNSITFYLDTNEETLKRYPFYFHFEVTYTLNDNELNIEYKVKNKDTKAIYFMVGGHPAYIVDGSLINNIFEFKDIKVSLDKSYDLERLLLNETGDLIISSKKEFNQKTIDVSKSNLKSEKTLIYKASDVKQVSLLRKNIEILFNVEKSPYLAFWNMYDNGNYLCVEPWWGVPDYSDCLSDFDKKIGMNKLEVGKEFKTGFSTKYIVRK